MRPDKDTYFLRHATIAAQMSTCVRRSVGCVLVNARRQIVGVGFNGVPSGMEHCNDGHPCPGADSPSGTNLSNCFAVHAEVNAVIQCRDPYSIDTVYTTTAPCVDCTKFLMNTSAKRIVFIEAYPHGESQRLWESVGRLWEHKPHGAGGHWDLAPTYPVPMMTGTKAYHHEGCPKCHGRGFVCVLDDPPEKPPVDLFATPKDNPQHKPDCAILAGVTRMFGCTCGLFPPRKPRMADPNCSICKGSGRVTVSIGGGCMGYDDEERTCKCVKNSE